MSAAKAKSLFEAGKVQEAASVLAAVLRDHPTDVQSRTFLFELLCFSGQYDRAEKHLHLLADSSEKAKLGAVLYFSALHGERTRHDLFRTELYPESKAGKTRRGTLNGKPFESISDADPVIGPRLEVFAAGAYLWVGFEHIQSIVVEAPKKLRDTLWLPAMVLAGPTFQGADLGEVLVPVVYPFTWKDADESLWLGRGTQWCADEKNREFPIGQKILLVDGEEVPLLEVRSIQFESEEAATSV
jgi:type VI secretion system protein ImpE